MSPPRQSPRPPSPRPSRPEWGAAALATSVPRLVGGLLLALPYVVRQLPPLIEDVRLLVNELARLANGADPGALANVVEELARLARVDGELTELVRETARLSGAKADEIHARLAREGPGSGPEVST